MGTPKELAAKMKQDKIEKLIDETIKKEQQVGMNDYITYWLD